jgi:hypothetical protein
MNPFDYVNSILQNKKDLMIDEATEKEYNSFLVNRSLSYHKDCVYFANEMNTHYHLDKKLQYHFLLNTVRGYKRPFAKWVKPEKSEDLSCVKEAFGFSNQKALDALRLLSDEQIQQLKQQTHKGGLGKK